MSGTNGGNPTAAWSSADDKNFVDSLVNFPEAEELPERLRMIMTTGVNSLPGESPDTLIGHHAALAQDVSVPLLTYSESPSPSPTSEKRSSSSELPTTSKRRACEGERKKGTPWTIEEHMLFLRGMEIYGRSDWRTIARNVVITRSSSQVASHAQKFFNRQKLGPEQRKRSSIHDIATVKDAMERLRQAEPPSSPSPSTASLNHALASLDIPSIHPSPSTSLNPSPTASLINHAFMDPSSLHLSAPTFIPPSTHPHPHPHPPILLDDNPFAQPPTLDNSYFSNAFLLEYIDYFPQFDTTYSGYFTSDHTTNSNAMFYVPDQTMFVPGPGPSNQSVFVPGSGAGPHDQTMLVSGPADEALCRYIDSSM